MNLLIFERVGKASGEAEAKLPPLSAGRGDGMDGVTIRDSIGTSFRGMREGVTFCYSPTPHKKEALT